MLTTTDNAYNPFTNFQEWYDLDRELGYNTCDYLGRVARTSVGLSDADNEAIMDDAINEIVALNLSGKHVKVDEKTAVEVARKARLGQNVT